VVMIPRKSAKTQDIVVMYTERHLTVRQIGELVGLSGAGVSKRLKYAGVTSHDGEWVKVECSYCGREHERRRGSWRKVSRSYCSKQCYYYSRENPDYKPWRQGQSMARQIVARLFPLQAQHVVHHKDGDNTNNDLPNLAVYASQSDHMTYHHGIHAVTTLWDGDVK
jgi:hypothetical protein